MSLTVRNFLFVLAALQLAGCASQNQPTYATAPEPMAPQMLSAADIRSAMSGKSWRWTSAATNISGVTLYAENGTSLVEVVGKGTTTGTWKAIDGQLCESFAPAPFLPQGKPMTCQPISGSGNSYQVGKARFTLSS
jgi:hypothetical protein